MESIVQKELPTIVSDGAFGENVDFVSFEQNKDLTGTDQYQSTVIFGTVTTSDESRFEVLVKLKILDKIERKLLKNDEQFHNEITMYEKIIPLLFANHCSKDGNAVVPSVPRYFYGRNRCVELEDDDLIIIENAIPLGYKLSEERIFLDYEHHLSAVTALAKFHALSYTAKHKDYAKFQDIISDIYNLHPKHPFENIRNALFKIGERGIDDLLKRSGPDLYPKHEHLRRFKEFLRNDENCLRRALEPREPFSVLCHGDFNRNNLLFRYDEAENPIDAMLFDFGTPYYGSPALDLSFLLYMNTKQTLRENRWDDLLDAYCSTVASSVPAGVRVPNRTELNSEMTTCALYGLAIASYFLPIMLEENPFSLTEKDVDEKIDIIVHLGGESGTRCVADMVQHFINVGYGHT